MALTSARRLLWIINQDWLDGMDNMALIVRYFVSYPLRKGMTCLLLSKAIMQSSAHVQKFFNSQKTRRAQQHTNNYRSRRGKYCVKITNINPQPPVENNQFHTTVELSAKKWDMFNDVVNCTFGLEICDNQCRVRSKKCQYRLVHSKLFLGGRQPKKKKLDDNG